MLPNNNEEAPVAQQDQADQLAGLQADQLAGLQAERDALIAERNALRAENAVKAGQLTELQAERDALRAENTTQADLITGLQEDDIPCKNQEIDNLRRFLDIARAIEEELRRREDLLEDTNRNLLVTKGALEAEKGRLEAGNADLAKKLAQLEKSTLDQFMKLSGMESQYKTQAASERKARNVKLFLLLSVACVATAAFAYASEESKEKLLASASVFLNAAMQVISSAAGKGMELGSAALSQVGELASNAYNSGAATSAYEYVKGAAEGATSFVSTVIANAVGDRNMVGR